MWRQQNKVNQKDDFAELMHLMSIKQMQVDADFDNNRVFFKDHTSRAFLFVYGHCFVEFTLHELK